MNRIALVILIILLLLCTSADYQIRRQKYFNKLPVLLDHNFKTGDVVVMCSDSIYDSLNYTTYWAIEVLQYYITKNFMTHLGIIVVHDKPYIYHMTAYPTWDDYHKMYVHNGPVYQDIHKYIYEYVGYVLIYRAPEIDYRIRTLCEHHPYRYSINLLNWAIDLNFKTTFFTRHDELYCYELVAYLLNITNYRNISASEFIEHIHRMNYSGPYIYNNLYMKYHCMYK